jgi:hypothetical protein
MRWRRWVGEHLMSVRVPVPGGGAEEAKVKFEVIGGPEGACLAVFPDDGGGERIAGPKPWGGGKTLHSWSVPVRDVLKALGRAER